MRGRLRENEGKETKTQIGKLNFKVAFCINIMKITNKCHQRDLCTKCFDHSIPA
jgi:hypothetical protein